ncbi:MAG: baseplate J/gp47 family protein [Lachnospiraceae bacterium]|nr:baseplate J/gp47 family protein [Lachnospiraceae bacterium]
MAQPEFTAPDFVADNTPGDIHSRMMANLPYDIDDMVSGFPYDFTMPSAIEKAELIEFHLVRALMLAYPQYAWEGWLDLHGQQVHVTRHGAAKASGYLLLNGEAGTVVKAGTVFCVPAAGDTPAIEYKTDRDCVVGVDGAAEVPITASEPGSESNVKAGAVSIMAEPLDEITGITNPEPVTGGAGEENDDSYYDRIAAEYENSMTYLGNDSDYKRWAQEAGAGDCIVDAAANGPGTVKLVLVDANGQPASSTLLEQVYDYIVSPEDRGKRLLPTACAELECVAAATVAISYTCTGLEFDATTSLGQIKLEFRDALKTVYTTAKNEGVLRYNDVRPLISAIPGVQDFETFLMNGSTSNIRFEAEEYPETGICEFS